MSDLTKPVTLEEIGMAYRKAKVDTYYSGLSRSSDIIEYESRLIDNLKELASHINKLDEKWLLSEEILGDFTLGPKGIEHHINTATRIVSDPTLSWQMTMKSGTSKPKAEFRVFSNHSINFHILSSLWISRVGHKFDEKLSSCSMGNRIRRTKDGRFNNLSAGTFQRYLRPFRQWRDKGLLAIQDSLNINHPVIAITADVSSFYHNVSPSFLTNKDYLASIGLSLGDDEHLITKLFVKALIKWSKTSPVKKGLPVGLPASAIIANAALIEFDRIIENNCLPIYYGRYVDDIILVLDNSTKQFSNDKDAWNWIIARSDGLLIKDAKKIEFSPGYFTKGCQISFDNSKNKSFILSGKTGLALIDSIKGEISKRASEWRALPSLPETARGIATKILSASQSDGELADNLRKTDGLSVKRSEFAMILRDMEAYERSLPRNAWQLQRHAFYSAVMESVITPVSYFELSSYIPRIIQLAMYCEDFDIVYEMIRKIEIIVKVVGKDCLLSIKGADHIEVEKEEILSKWNEFIKKQVLEAVTAGFPAKMNGDLQTKWDGLSTGFTWIKFPNSTSMQIKSRKYFHHDLGYKPYRNCVMPEYISDQLNSDVVKLNVKNLIRRNKNYLNLLGKTIRNGVELLCEVINRHLENPSVIALAFPTRPYSAFELQRVIPRPHAPKGISAISSIILASRGYKPSAKIHGEYGKKPTLSLPGLSKGKRVNIALPSWLTMDDSYVASVSRLPDPDLSRYNRINHLLNQILTSKEKIDYIIFPELALPSKWFPGIAQKLSQRGISIISGIEYIHTSSDTVSNQVWASLVYDESGYRSHAFYAQEKQLAALHEEHSLDVIAGKKMSPTKHGKWSNPPIINHGQFSFSILICSELTNIKYRSAIRGKVDGVFIPEWNQDIESFGSLIESSAIDIHAFIIQCNNRCYGDSRIRSPSKNSWQRDITRTRGGITDYFVIGTIDIGLLRSFQSYSKSPSHTFKPVPDGFSQDMESSRKSFPSIPNKPGKEPE